ncbi:hypothetical protein AMTR_s00009p00212200 [Amborella trichopoda]|uniref:ARID domain-containing protein n=1 Tax=Amborella trichopoda TaxID=13333 RepID=W1NHJ6_AMBTC|nr:hypothetical protein AMTR_s00009p00212200 [Amborella trichopoda]
MDIVGNSDEDLLSKGKIKVLFNQILKAGAKGSQEKEGRPFPPMVGDGRSIDLYSLFLVVWKKGGYDSVSKSCAWSSVADELCFESSCGAPIKLVYAKYLSFMDRWMEAHGLDFKNCLEALVHGNMHKKNGMHASCELDCNGKELRTPSKQSAYASPKLDCNGPKHEAPSKQRGENLNISVIYVDSEDEKVDGNICSPTWKREPLILMLKWLKGVAKYPGDPKIGLDESGKGNPIVEKYRAQCILARKAFLLKREEYSGSGDSFAQGMTCGFKGIPFNNKALSDFLVLSELSSEPKNWSFDVENGITIGRYPNLVLHDTNLRSHILSFGQNLPGVSCSVSLVATYILKVLVFLGFGCANGAEPIMNLGPARCGLNFGLS